ncbi:hypothetical protein HID58_039355 [Brassica napus]|uniref:AT-hook motif nuclear-localized protein n=1 Tax=Brassica napus TaxID=3708 RepID=A0ABQ8BRY5_BRANA|nr:hypothetical protein HID58_039355 [Brassica napus]
MANISTILADLKSGCCSSTVEVLFLRFGKLETLNVVATYQYSHATLMEATVEFSHGQSSVGTVIRVESSRFLLTGYVNLEASQTAIVGISAFINSCTNGQMSHL